MAGPRDGAGAEAEALRAENRRLGLDLDDLREENRRLRAAAEQMRAEILTLGRALEPMHRLTEEMASWRPLIAKLGGAARDDAQATLAAARAERLAHALRAVHASSSWRLTRPWRALGRLARGRGGAGAP